MSWQEVSLNEFLINRQDRFKPNDKRIQNLKRIDKIDFSGQIFLSEKPSKTDMILVKKGDLVISGINVEKGAMSVYEGQEDVTATIHYSSYHFNSNKINIDFLKLFLKSIEFKNAIKEQVPGGIKTEIKPKHLLPLKIIIPKSTIEQAQIVKNFDLVIKNISKVSDELTHQTEILNQLRQQILQDAIQGKLVPQDPKDEPASVLLEKIKTEKEELVKEGKLKKQKPLPPIKDEEFPFEIPKSWVWCRLGNICKSILDGTHFSPTNSQTGKFKYITAKNIKEFGIDLTNVTYITKEAHENIYSKCNPEKGDVLFIKDGATTGVVTINNLSEQFSLLSSVALLKIPKFIDNKYFMYAMRSPYYYNSTRNDMYGVAITRVTLIKIQNSMLPIPPIGEQKRIVKKVEELLKICDELEQEITQSQNFSQQLLQSALKEALAPK